MQYFVGAFEKKFSCNLKFLTMLLLDSSAHWFQHYAGIANSVKMALWINNLWALWENFHLDCSDNGPLWNSLNAEAEQQVALDFSLRRAAGLS